MLLETEAVFVPAAARPNAYGLHSKPMLQAPEARVA